MYVYVHVHTYVNIHRHTYVQVYVTCTHMQTYRYMHVCTQGYNSFIFLVCTHSMGGLCHSTYYERKMNLTDEGSKNQIIWIVSGTNTLYIICVISYNVVFRKRVNFCSNKTIFVRLRHASTYVCAITFPKRLPLKSKLF